jgi:hypothetical protein
VARHIEAIEQADPRARHAYLALARLTADRALASGVLKPEDAERLLGALGDSGAPGSSGTQGPS